ncbi:MAG: FAD-dependent oxidoreductase [Alphaproteobacteria bacterium]|nr:FAD-dependent oxidoreductase [Alphaproteobacteria bacterium]
MAMRKVAKLAALREDRGLRVEIGDEKIMLLRDGDAVRAYSAICPHAGGPLDEGAVCDGRIVCPWHKGTFRLSDGALLEPPPLDRLARYPVEVDGDDVLVSPEKIVEPQPSPPADPRVMLIAGAGAAGAAAVAALREFGFGGRIVLVGREQGPPFDRTSLSKFVVAGQMPPEETPSLLPDTFYADQRIERIEGELSRLDVRRREATLADGHTLQFDAALIATGSVPRALDLPGVDLPGVHMLRTRQDAAAILADVRRGAPAVILGSSFIGLEIASCLREQEMAVSVVAPEEVPFARQFGERIGRSFRTLHEAHGVRFHLGTEAVRLDGTGRVESVVLKDGSVLPARLVIIGVGVRLATEFVEGVEREKDGGVPVDATMRVADQVYAAGDIAAFPLPSGGPRARIEHWRVAQQQARIAARNMLGGDAAYDGVPFFWTYHYEKTFEYLGHAKTWDDVVIEGDLDRQDFAALLVQGGMVGAVVACGRDRVTAILAERLRGPLSTEAALRIIRSA